MIDFAMKELIALLNEIKPQYGAVGSRDVDVTAQRQRIDEAIAMLEKTSTVSPEQTNILGYFSFDPDDGAEILKDRQTAIDNCNTSIDLYRETMQNEYPEGWSDDVKRVCWGVILQEARGFDAQGIPEDDPNHTYQTLNYRLAPELAELQTVRLAPHVYRQLVNDLRDVALAYHGTQHLREKISRTLSATLTADHPHLAKPASNNKPLIDMDDADHFSVTHLHEIIYGKELVWPEAKLLARFMLDVKQRFSAQEQSND